MGALTWAMMEAESVAFRNEIRPPTLVALSDGVRSRFGLPATAVGIKGDEDHLSGGHRSPEWIYTSAYSTRGSGDGSLITTTGGRVGSTNRDLRALDITPGAWGTAANRALMRTLTARLDAAVRAGRLPQVRRFWGTLDGSTVYGWDTFYDRTTTSDDSHLDHLHIEMYPDRVRDDHSNVLAVLTGGADMDPNASDIIAGVPNKQVFADLWHWVVSDRRPTKDALDSSRFRFPVPGRETEATLTALKADVAAVKSTVAALVQAVSTGGSVEAVPIIAAMERLAAEDKTRDDRHQAELTALRTALAESVSRENALADALAAAGAALATADDSPAT